MDQETTNMIIKFELAHIPKGSKGSTQNKLRFHYVAYRRRGIAKGIKRAMSQSARANIIHRWFAADKNRVFTDLLSLWGFRGLFLFNSFFFRFLFFCHIIQPFSTYRKHIKWVELV